MSGQNKNPLMGEKKKKRHLWGLWVPLIVIFSIVVIPLGFAMLLFYDPHHIDTGITNRKNETQVFGTMMTDMFDGCRNEEPTIDLKITQKQLNQLLYNASASMPEQSQQYLKQFSVQITDDSYVFDLEIEALKVAKTHLVLRTQVTSNATLRSGEKGFLFKITDLKVGRLGNLDGILPWLANTAGIDLSTIFAGAGLSIAFDVENLELSYPYDSFINDISGRTGSSDPLFLSIFSNFFKEELITFTHHENVDVTGTISLNDFLVNPLYTNSDYVINPMAGENGDIPLLTYYSDVVAGLIDSGVIANDDDVASNARTITKLLAYGQDFLNEDERIYASSVYGSIKDTYCGGLDMEAYSTNRKFATFGDTHAGIMDRVTSTVSSKIAEMDEDDKIAYLAEVTSTGKAYLYSSENPIVVTDKEIQKMLMANDSLVGYGFSFVGEKEDGNTKVAYSMLDNAYPTILPATETTPDMMSLTFGLNINGAQTSLVMPMEGNEIHNDGKHGLSFSIKDAELYFGTKIFPDLKDQLQTIINRVKTGDGDDKVIQFTGPLDPNTGETNIEEIQLVFDFKDYFETHSESEFTIFNKRAEGEGAKLIVEFDFASSAADAPGKRAGQFNVSIGYALPE